VLPHILGNGVFALNDVAVPFLKGGVNVGLGRAAFFRLLRRADTEKAEGFSLSASSIFCICSCSDGKKLSCR
jgi:hypothetical protein